MSQSLINHNADLKRLADDGYDVDIVSGHLVVRDVPYVNSKKEVKQGILVSNLELAGDDTVKPSEHVVMFAGEHPCSQDGCKLLKIEHSSEQKKISESLTVYHSFSSKPTDGYKDYHHKMSTYASIISDPARAIDPNVTAQPGRVTIPDNSDTVFKYCETASSRAGITALSSKLKSDKVAIVGLGGTGSYILDFVAKTSVQEIHLFDGDDFLQHNAFRSPGAPSKKELEKRHKKVDYHAKRYGRMRRGIFKHQTNLAENNLNDLEGMDFVFICVDSGGVKRPIVEKLEEIDIPFIDVGMGINCVDDKLLGILRVTTSTPDKREHVRSKNRFGLSGGNEDNQYSTNIQIAELNALNACLAVIRWKKMRGFYLDLQEEHHSTYVIDGNTIANEDRSRENKSSCARIRQDNPG